MSELVHVSNIFYTEPMVSLAGRLSALSGLDRVFFANCGATVNETAIKLARRFAQKRHGAHRYEVISLLDSFHGAPWPLWPPPANPPNRRPSSPSRPGFFRFLPEISGRWTALYRSALRR